MTCKEFQDRRVDYYEAELDDASRTLMAQHAQACATCKKSYEEIKEVYAKLNLVKTITPEPPDSTYFSTLLARTRQRIEQEQKPPLWERASAFFRMPIVALSLAMVFIVLIFSLSEIGDISLFRQKNVYSSLAQELKLLGPHGTYPPYPEDEPLLLEDLNQLTDEQFNTLLNSLET